MKEHNRNFQKLENTQDVTLSNNCALVLHAFNNMHSFDLNNSMVLASEPNQQKKAYISNATYKKSSDLY